MYILERENASINHLHQLSGNEERLVDEREDLVRLAYFTSHYCISLFTLYYRMSKQVLYDVVSEIIYET